MAGNALTRTSGPNYGPTPVGPGINPVARPATSRPTPSARDRIIPNWDPSGQLTPRATGTIQRASAPQVLQVQTVADDAIIPIIYGTPERIAGMPYTSCLASNGADLLVSFIVCEGEVASLGNVQVGDQAPPAGCTFTTYTGTATQAINADLVAAIPGFDEPMPGTAYLVGRFAPGALSSFPNVTVQVGGLLIPDSRIGNTLGPWDNPALVLAHFMRTWGRRTVNVASVNAAADFCDAMVGTPGAKRARLTITLAESQDVDAWIEVLRGYVPAWVVFKDGQWHIIPDTTTGPVLDYNADTDNRTDGEGPMQLFKRGVRDVPNVLEVEYTDTSVVPWTTRKATAEVPGVGAGSRRKSTLTMPGIRTYDQAYRFAVERLNHYTLEQIEGQVNVMDDGIAILPGDIITITDSAQGWATKPVRVLRVDERDNGRWSVRFREFTSGAYANSSAIAPALPSSGTLPNPLVVGAITGLTATESLKFELDSISKTDGLARGLIWQSRIVATWTASADPYIDFYEVQLQSSSLAQPSVTTSKLAQFCSAPLVQGSTYTVSVRAVNTLGFTGAWSTVTVNVLGKQTPPSDVTILDTAVEAGGEVILRWRAVPDVDIVRYELRQLGTTASTAPWDSMVLVDRPDTNYIRVKGLSVGPTLFALKAIDSVGRYSVNPLYVNITVTSDSESFLQGFNFTPQSNVDLLQENFPIVEGGTRPLPRWITAGTVVWDLAMPNPVASAATPVVDAWGRNAAWTHRTDVWDFGLVLQATVKLNLTWSESLRGNFTLYLVTSQDGSTWDYSISFPINNGVASAWVSASVLARFVKVEVWSAANTDVFMQEGQINAQVSSVTRTEAGQGTSSASTFTRVNLAQKYTKAVAITITPQGTTFATPSYTNVQVGLGLSVNSFDMYLFNSSAVQVAMPFSWTFSGV